MPHTCVLIPGDGIGPEVAAATQHVLDSSGAPISWVSGIGGCFGPGGRTRRRIADSYGRADSGARVGTQGTLHHSNRRGLHQRQRGTAQDASTSTGRCDRCVQHRRRHDPVRPTSTWWWCERTPKGLYAGHRERDHPRGSSPRSRSRPSPPASGSPEFAFQFARDRGRRKEITRLPQGQHPQAVRRHVHQRLPCTEAAARRIPTSSTTNGSSMPGACGSSRNLPISTSSSAKISTVTC